MNFPDQCNGCLLWDWYWDSDDKETTATSNDASIREAIEANQSRKYFKGLCAGCYHLKAGLKHCDFADYVNALPGGLLEGPHELEY